MSQPCTHTHKDTNTHKHTQSPRLQGTSISAGTRLHKVVMVALQPVNAVVYNPRPLLFFVSLLLKMLHYSHSSKNWPLVGSFSFELDLSPHRTSHPPLVIIIDPDVIKPTDI